MTTQDSRPTLSLVCPVYNEAENLRALVDEVHSALRDVLEDYELVFVDDGSRDGSVDLIEELHREDPRVVMISLSRNFGKEAAILAAYDVARGRAVVVLDGDLQTPPRLIPEMLERWNGGASIVDAVRISNEGANAMRSAFSRLFYSLINRLGNVDVTRNASDFRLLDGRVVDELRRCRERHRFNRGLVGWTGFRRDFIEFEAPGRSAGDTSWSAWKLASYALDALLAFSSAPLRFAGTVGLLLSLLSFVYLVILGYIRVFHGQPLPGYATLAGGIFLLGGVQLTTIWLLGEYVGRIYEEVKQRPVYVVTRALGCEAPSDAAPSWNR